MAGNVGKTRGPVVVWLLSIITLGIYFLYWYFKVNEELAEYDSSIEVSPGIALLAQFVPIANFVSFFNTGTRITQAKGNEECSPVVGLLLQLFVLGTGMIYYQSHLNKLWAGTGDPAAAA